MSSHHSATEPSTASPGNVSAISGSDSAGRGARTAENIRYGQALSEEGMGGQTVGMTGEANSAGSGGSSEQQGTSSAIGPQEAAGSGSEQARVGQGYGGDKDMDKTIGA